MKPSEILATPERWTQKGYAIRAPECFVAADDIRACAWCLTGAVFLSVAQRIPGDPSTGEILAARQDARILIFRCLLNMLGLELPEPAADQHNQELEMIRILALWNDAPERTHAEVIAVLKSIGE